MTVLKWLKEGVIDEDSIPRWAVVPLFSCMFGFAYWFFVFFPSWCEADQKERRNQIQGKYESLHLDDMVTARVTDRGRRTNFKVIAKGYKGVVGDPYTLYVVLESGSKNTVTINGSSLLSLGKANKDVDH